MSLIARCGPGDRLGAFRCALGTSWGLHGLADTIPPLGIRELSCKLRARVPLRVGTRFSGLEAPSGVLRLMGIPSVVLFCSDISAPSSAISNYYNPDVIHLGDVWGIEEDDLPAVDLVLLGPPCQPFSTLVTNRTEVDPRAELFARGCQLATATRAPLIIVEEVRTILRESVVSTGRLG